MFVCGVVGVCFQSHWMMNMIRNIQFLIFPILRQYYVDEFVMFKLNSFSSSVLLVRAICTTLNRKLHIPIFQAFIETE